LPGYAATLRTIAADPKQLDARIGTALVLGTAIKISSAAALHRNFDFIRDASRLKAEHSG
jgi:hypothetical protein